MRPAHLFAEAVHLRVNVGVIIGVDKAHIRPHQPFEKLIAHTVCYAALFEHENSLHPQLPRRGGGQHGVVGLRAAGREDDFRPLRFRVGQEKFELSDLVSAEPEPGHIVALDIDVPSKESADVFKLMDRRRQDAQADPREAFNGFHGVCAPLLK